MKNNSYQGFQSLEDNIGKIIKPMARNKKDSFFILSSLIKNWPAIIGEKYYPYCVPQKVKISKEHKITLFINAHNSAVAFYLEGNYSQILEKIAAYFGYKIINEIRISQELREIAEKKAKKEVKLTAKDQEFIDQNIENIVDENLKNVLRQLGQEIFNKTN